MPVAVHDNGQLHVHLERVAVAGAHNLAIYIEGDYCPDHDIPHDPGHEHNAAPTLNSNSGGQY